jgi:hypothetical protein
MQSLICKFFFQLIIHEEAYNLIILCMFFIYVDNDKKGFDLIKPFNSKEYYYNFILKEKILINLIK